MSMEWMQQLIQEHRDEASLIFSLSLSLALVAAGKLARYLASDRATAEQLKLEQALNDRLIQQSAIGQWRIDGGGYLVLYDADDHPVQSHSLHGQVILLGERDVEPLLTGRQRRRIHKLAQLVREKVMADNRALEYLSAISEARRPVA